MHAFKSNLSNACNILLVKRIFLSLLLVSGSLMIASPIAKAETEVIQAQIISTNTSWGNASKSLKIDGLIQIRTGVTLTINAGTSLDVSRGSFLVLGTLSIVGNPNNQVPTVLNRNWLSGSGEISISGLNVTGNGGTLVSEAATGVIKISDSIISKMQSISEQTQSRSFSFSGNTVFRVNTFYGNLGFHSSYSVVISNNSFYEIEKIGGENPGIYVRLGQTLPSYIFTGNYFENISTVLAIEPRDKDLYPNLNVGMNNFATPGRVLVRASTIDFSGNYWKDITSENQLRSQVKVLDGLTNITLPVMKFIPLLTTAPASQSSLVKLKILLDAEIRAAAEAKAIADKAAAEAKAIADKAAAEAKAIADKAAAELNRKEQSIIINPVRLESVSLSSSGLQVKVSATSNLPVFAYNSTNDVCEYQNGVIRTKMVGRCVIGFSQEGDSNFKPAANLILDFAIVASGERKSSITCFKGKLTKKVTAINPKCPPGYKIKK